MSVYDVFLSGPITGRPDYRAEFGAAEAWVRDRHPRAVVWNPCFTPQGRTYAFYMKRCVAALFGSAVVVLLPGWRQSPGACAEYALAKALGIPCVEPWGEPPAGGQEGPRL